MGEMGRSLPGRYRVQFWADSGYWGSPPLLEFSDLGEARANAEELAGSGRYVYRVRDMEGGMEVGRFTGEGERGR